jgi:tetratricopeptide (TPR) repeat protein
MQAGLPRQAPADRPDIQQAIDLHRSGHLYEAAQAYSEILACEPGHFDALHLLGLVRHQQGDPIEGLRWVAAALKVNATSADALSNYGLILDILKRHQEALECFEKALLLQCDHVNTLNNRGLSLLALGRNAEALASWDRALATDPDHVDASRNRGNALRSCKQFAAALASYERVLALQPDNLDVLNNCGSTLADLGRFEEAIACFDRALAISPHQPELLINKGNVLVDLHRFEEALSCYGAAIGGSRHAEAKWRESLVRLRLGQFDRGWRDYEWRWQQASWASQRRNFAAPQWSGNEPLAGKTIMLHAEQGFGDTLQFVRYAKHVAELGPTVLLEVQPPLIPLLSGLAGVTSILPRGETLPAFDFHCPLMSLPLALRTTADTIPADIPYLRAPGDRIAIWRERLGVKRRLRVGICWAGNPAHQKDSARSIALSRLRPLVSAAGIEFVSLQRDLAPPDAAVLRSHRDIVHVGSDLRDFADTAAVISLLDLVVSVDTSIAHLAGALGRPVWVLLPFSSDFRWLVGREDSPWYPTARLFRQPRSDDWESVLASVQADLCGLAAAA